MRTFFCHFVIPVFGVVSHLGAQFVDVDPNLSDLPRVPDGFTVSLYAKEPLVRNPCSLAFDAAGRMFVGMGPQYRNPAPETPPDSIVIVEDRNDDGVADGTRVFATGFNCIQGLAWRGRDLWVANVPDLTVVRDTDGDDVADEYVRVYADLGNIEHGIHGLNVAPDGRMYMSKGNSKGVVIREWKKDEPDRIAPKPFRELWGVPGPADAPDFPPAKSFTRDSYHRAYQDPRDDWGRMGGVLRCGPNGENLEIVARGFRNPYDIAFDDGFDWLGTDQDQNEGDRIVMPFYGAEFGWSHAWSPHWTGKDHLPTAPVSGPVFNGSGTGIVWADSPAWPDKFRKVWIINDWLLKSTQIYRPAWDGALMQPEGGKWEDFVIGRGSLYRPVDLAFGPDGALYILGWGRGYGVTRDAAGEMTNEGRIFRLMPAGARPLVPVTAKPGDLTVEQLTADFDSVVLARRGDAQDELVRRGKRAEADLTAMPGRGSLTKSQETWILWTLARTGVADAWFQARAGKGAVNARMQALRILGFRKSPALAAVLGAALADGNARVRFAAVQAVHQGRLTDLTDQLVAHAAREHDRVTAYAVWRALRDLLSAERLRPLLKHEAAGIRRAALLALIDTAQLTPPELEVFTHDPDTAVKTVALLALGKSAVPASPPPVSAPSAGYVPVANLTAESRRQYLPGTLTTGQTCYTDRPYAFKKVPESLSGAAIIRTANEDDNSRGESFLTFDLAVESTVMVAHDVRLKERPEWLSGFADSDLTVTTDDTEFRLWSKDFAAGPVVLGGNLASPARGGKAHYFVVIVPRPLPALTKVTTPEAALAALKHASVRRGEALFFVGAGCAACHRTGGRGTNFGPDLTNAGDRMDARFVVQSLLEPNAVITEGFSAHAIEADGKSYFGVLLSTGRTVKLGLAGGTTVELAEKAITKHETLPVSPMPPQGALLAPQDVADIAAWLVSQKSPQVAPVTAAPATSGLAAVLQADRLAITLDGKKAADFVFRDPAILRPYFASVCAPDGRQITRNHPPVAGQDPVDHADMHPGIWLAFGDISGTDFWRNKGRIEHVSFSQPPAVKHGVLTFVQDCRLVTAAGDSPGTLTNQCRVEVRDGATVIAWDAEFKAGAGGLVFGDQEEMGFGARVATPLTQKNGGRITSSARLESAAKTWGQPADWCDYSGVIDGQPCGITVMAAPGNFRQAWWHNRDYGLAVANPFGRAAMKQGDKSAVAVKPGEPLRLRFAAAVHSGGGYDPAAQFRKCFPQQAGNR